MRPSDSSTRPQQLYRPGFFPDVRPIAAIRARIWIAQGKLSEAADWARDRGVSATDDVSYLSEFDHLTLVRLLLAQHRATADTGALDQAAGLLDRLLARRRDVWTRRKPPRDPPAARAGSRRARTSAAGPGVPRRSLGAGTRTRGLRPALPGRGCSHAEPAARCRAPGRRRRPPRDACSASAHLPQAEAPDPRSAGRIVGRVR